MLTVTQKHNNESFESLIRRFKKLVEKEDILREVQEREFYEKPTTIRKRARASAKKRAQRSQEIARTPQKR